MTRSELFEAIAKVPAKKKLQAFSFDNPNLGLIVFAWEDRKNLGYIHVQIIEGSMMDETIKPVLRSFIPGFLNHVMPFRKTFQVEVK